MKTALYVKDLYVSYHGNEALNDISFSLESGQLVGIIGPNGAGKSTLLKALLNLIPKDKGEIEILDSPLKDIRKSIAYVPQRNQIDWDFPITVLDTVLLGTYPKLGMLKKPRKREKKWARLCLERVGMEEYVNRQIGELSGGQQQRVFLARALVQEADIFFLDEPFVGIDLSSEETIIKILKELRTSGKTILVVHHDLSKVNQYFDQLVLLNKELITYGNIDRVLSPDILAKGYSNQLTSFEDLGGGL